MKANRYLMAIALPVLMGLSASSQAGVDDNEVQSEKPAAGVTSMQRTRLRTVENVQRSVNTVVRASTMRRVR